MTQLVPAKFKNILNSEHIKNTIRATVAVLISLLFAHFAKMQFPYWITMITILVAQSNFGASLMQARNRIFGTILGLLVGLMLVMFFHKSTIFLYISFPILIFIFSYIITFSQIWAVFVISGLIGIIFASVYPDAWNFIFWRINDVIFGALIALSTIFILFPRSAKNELDESLIAGLNSCQRLLNTILGDLFENISENARNDIVKQVINIEILLAKKRQSLIEYNYEPYSMLYSKHIIYDALLAEERIHSLILGILTIFDNQNLKVINHLQKPLNEFTKINTIFITDLITAIQNSTNLPNTDNLHAKLRQIKEYIFTNKTILGPCILLYRNLVGYIVELDHIVQGRLQLRKSS